MQRHRHRRNQARPLNSNPIDERASNNRAQKAAGIRQRVGEVGEPGRGETAAAQVRDGVGHGRADEGEAVGDGRVSIV